MSHERVTLHDLECLPDRDQLVRIYIRSIALRLRNVIRQSRLAHKLNDTQRIDALRNQYLGIRGEQGRPATINAYLVSGNGGKGHMGVNDAIVEIIQQSRDLSTDTIMRYMRRYYRDWASVSGLHADLRHRNEWKKPESETNSHTAGMNDIPEIPAIPR